MHSYPDIDLSTLLRVAYRASRREGLSHSDAEDAASVAITHFLEAKRPVEYPMAWVSLVARRKAWSLLRRERRRDATMELWGAAGEGISRNSDDVETHLDLKAALASLDVVEMQVLVSCYVEENGMEAVAQSIGLSLSSAKRRLRRGRESLARAVTGRSLRRYLHHTNLTSSGGA